MDDATTTLLRGCLARFRSGDSGAGAQLLEHTQDRLRLLCRRMLRRFPLVQRCEDTDDICQEVLLRLAELLKQQYAATLEEFLALASLVIRNKLIDLARHYRHDSGLGIDD